MGNNGKGKTMKKTLRTEQVTLQCTTEEKAKLEAAATAASLSLSAWARSQLLRMVGQEEV